MMLMIERINLETGELDSVITPEEALDKLVPAYYVDRELVEHALINGEPIRTSVFEYRKAKTKPTTVASLRF